MNPIERRRVRNLFRFYHHEKLDKKLVHPITLALKGKLDCRTTANPGTDSIGSFLSKFGVELGNGKSTLDRNVY